MATVMTHTGEIPASDLGPTLPHEHFFVNIMQERREVLLLDERLITDEVKVFAEQGGTTLFELSNSTISKGAIAEHVGHSDARFTRPAENVAACIRVADAAGLQMVLSTGYYRDPYLDAVVLNEYSTNDLAGFIISDILEGFPGTNVKAGIIGEIGANKQFVTALEERSFRAAARAGVKTNRAIYTHAVFWPVARQQIEILEEEGVDLTRVAIGHTDTVPIPGYAVELASRGVYVGLDSIQSANPTAVQNRVRMVKDLIEAGYLEQILLSHDVCMPAHMTSNGGNGFGFVLGGFKQALLEAGVGEEEFTVITNENPARLAAY